MQAAIVNFEYGNKQMGADYVNENKRIVRQQIMEAIQTLCNQEGIKGEKASQLRRQAIDAIIISLNQWEQIYDSLTAAISEIRTEIPVGNYRFAMKKEIENQAEPIGGRISNVGNQLNVFYPNKDFSEGFSQADLIRNFMSTVKITAHSINELLYIRNNPSTEVIDSTHCST